jgi:exosortase
MDSNARKGAYGVRSEDFPTTTRQRDLLHRHLGFAIFLISSVTFFWKPIGNLIGFSLSHDYASHIILIVPLSAVLIWQRRDQIFSNTRSAHLAAAALFVIGTLSGWLADRYMLASSGDDRLSLVTLSIVIIWFSGFMFWYGPSAFARASFPLLFLLLLVPIPDLVTEKVIFLLQAGSAAVAYGLLRLFAVPVFKQGFILRLPTLDIEVAKQCSGIRSSLALLITVLILGHFALRSAWRKTFLVVSIVPILILKNGMRIVAVALLSIYVNRRFLHGWLHTSGGIVFYLLGLVILIPIVAALRRSESGNFVGVDS